MEKRKKMYKGRAVYLLTHGQFQSVVCYIDDRNKERFIVNTNELELYVNGSIRADLEQVDVARLANCWTPYNYEPRKK